MALRLSALRVGRLLSRRKIPGTHLCYRFSRPQGHSAAGRIRSVEKSNDFSGNRTRDVPACSIAPRPTTLPRAASPTELKYVTFYVRQLPINQPASQPALKMEAAGSSEMSVHIKLHVAMAQSSLCAYHNVRYKILHAYKTETQ
jgi:hypothetical protein